MASVEVGPGVRLIEAVGRENEAFADRAAFFLLQHPSLGLGSEFAGYRQT